MDVLRQLPEAFLGFAQRLLGPLPLPGHQSAPGPVQGLAQAADDGADQHGKDQSGHVVHAGEVERATLADDEVVRGGGAEDGGQQPGPEAAEVRRNHHCREECQVRDCVPQHRPERPPNQQASRCGEHGHAVGDQSGAGVSRMPTS